MRPAWAGLGRLGPAWAGVAGSSLACTEPHGFERRACHLEAHGDGLDGLPVVLLDIVGQLVPFDQVLADSPGFVGGPAVTSAGQAAFGIPTAVLELREQLEVVGGGRGLDDGFGESRLPGGIVQRGVQAELAAAARSALHLHPAAEKLEPFADAE